MIHLRGNRAGGAVLMACALAGGVALAEPIAEVAPTPPQVTNSQAQPADPGPEGASFELARHMAGGFGDPVRSVESLPGVVRATSESDGIVIWGARPEDSRVLVDGIEVPALLHVGSQRSAIGLGMPGSVELAPGAYGAGDGRALGGLVVITTRGLPGEGVHGAVEANLADASLLLSGAPTSRFRVGLSGTWSYAAHSPEHFGEAVTAFYGPARYHDFQAKAELDLSPQRRLTALVLGATEEAQPSDDRLYYNTRWYPPHERAWYRVALRYTDDRKSNTLVMPFVGWTSDDLNQVDSPYLVRDERHLHTLHYGARASRQIWLGEQAVLTVSLDGLFERTRASQAGSPSFPRRSEDLRAPSSGATFNLAPFDWLATVGDVAAALSLRWQVGHWTLFPAFRADVFPTFVDGGGPVVSGSVRHYPVTLGPRLAIEYLPHASVQLHAAAGLYAQPVSAADLSSMVGNPWLGPSQAAHGLAGVRWCVTGATSVEATGFVRQSWDVAVRSSAPDGLGLTSDGGARAYGAQLMVRKAVSARLDAWLAYTISRSEMRLDKSEPWILAPQDRTHALTALFVHRWRGWLTSARFRYASGPLYRPVVESGFNSSLDTYEPIYGAPNSGRMQDFVQADLRVGREFHLGPGAGSVFFDITNATSRRNEEAVLSYSYDYTRYAAISTPPRTYQLGARWQW